MADEHADVRSHQTWSRSDLNSAAVAARVPVLGNDP
jgi:hypothetical protein